MSEARDAKVWQPSTFGSRKAVTVPAAPKHPLVNMGRVEHRLPGAGRDAIGRIVEGDLLVELGINGRRLLRLGNGSTMDVTPAVHHEESVTPLGIVKRRGMLGDAEALSDPPPRRVV